jgi:dimethylaniline monooxygenase (N-oxide forming)
MDESSQTWVLRARDGSGEQTTWKTRHLSIASGHHADAVHATFPGLHSFQGVVMHSEAYKDHGSMEGKSVVVVGIGNSAVDIAINSSYVAKKVTLSTRSGAWIIPNYLFGLV